MSLAKDDYYQILNVSSDATEDEIRTAYQMLALANHPDKQLQLNGNSSSSSAENNNNHPVDTRPFIRITEAWNTLRDPELRRIYDAELFQGRIDEVPTVHQVLEASEVRRSTDGTGYVYTCRCGAECTVDTTHNNAGDNSWRYNTCDQCSHSVEMDVDLED